LLYDHKICILKSLSEEQELVFF